MPPRRVSVPTRSLPASEPRFGSLRRADPKARRLQPKDGAEAEPATASYGPTSETQPRNAVPGYGASRRIRSPEDARFSEARGGGAISSTRTDDASYAASSIDLTSIFGADPFAYEGLYLEIDNPSGQPLRVYAWSSRTGMSEGWTYPGLLSADAG